MKKTGFTLIELMIVVAIVAFLAIVAVPSYMRFLAKVKRAEAYVNLGTIYTAQKAHWAEHGTYSAILNGQNGVGWKPEGDHHYTYGFGGQEGMNYFKGKLPADVGLLSNAKADESGFVAFAVADIDGDSKYDLISIDDKHKVIIVQDDLVD
ncbi:MAG: prepilin-type N-terminal cleavage/methylation domain-containing protein [Candidatus Babeliales bacterium]